MTMINNKNMREYINSLECKASAELKDSIEVELKNLLESACERAKANNRQTVMSRDL